jgi:hypothetical protein
MSIGTIGTLLLACLAGAILGALAITAWHARKSKPAAPPEKKEEAPRREMQHYFLVNETGNVLISTTLSPSAQLPDATLAQFSEALAHLSAMFFAIAGARDTETNEPFSLYNYDVLKRALALHPVFIRVSEKEPVSISEESREPGPMLFTMQAGKAKSPASAQPDSKEWMDERVQRTRDALGMTKDEIPENADKLRAIHAQMRTEAMRLRSKQTKPENLLFKSVGVLPTSPPADFAAPRDRAEVAHIVLYCEYLMGASLVSLKLIHATCEDYLDSRSGHMEEDTYLFVSPSQLKKTLSDIESIPRVSMTSLTIGPR